MAIKESYLLNLNRDVVFNSRSQIITRSGTIHRRYLALAQSPDLVHWMAVEGWGDGRNAYLVA